MPEELEQELERAALAYLDRFDSSASNLRRVLERKARALAKDEEQASSLRQHIDALVRRYQASGLVDDNRYSQARVAGLRARGLGRRAILTRLRAKGVAVDVIEEALESVDEHSGDAEIDAARRYIKRRRLARYRSEAVSPKTKQKDLAALARAGFGFETARRALSLEGHGDDDDVF